jgi:hypothetical protein
MLRFGTTDAHSTPPRTYSQIRTLSIGMKGLKTDVGVLSSNDYGNESRQGNRVVGIGEVPYFDPKSRSRREALANDATV